MSISSSVSHDEENRAARWKTKWGFTRTRANADRELSPLAIEKIRGENENSGGSKNTETNSYH